jgi:polyhydroxyalkanoate synthase
MPVSPESALSLQQFLEANAEALKALVQPASEALADGPAFALAWARTMQQAPERLATLQREFYDEQVGLWRRALDAQPAPAEPDAKLPFFTLLEDQHRLMARWAEQLPAALEIEPQARRRMAFALRQWAEASAPANFLATNPKAIRAALESCGATLQRGLENLRADIERGRISMSDAGAFEVGSNLAVTPGAVVHETPIMQLIQYAPLTEKVGARPLLIVPPFINKYYILDLRPENSFVRFALEQGQQVFMVSWRNIPPELGSATWEDYLEQGVFAALEATLDIADSRDANVLGFCVGGTLSACAAAIEAARGGERIAHLTLLTTLLDFSDPGEISVFVDEASVAKREREFADGGVMPGSQLASAFASLRARDLIWYFVEHNYLFGETPRAFDLLHWNSDSANLPGRLYAWYLRNMYLENRLKDPGALTLLAEPIDLNRIAIPAYVLAAKEDHIVPWSSAFRTLNFLSGECRFVLAESGHVAGVINSAKLDRRGWWDNTDLSTDPAAWFDSALHHRGSWWHDWGAWIDDRCGRRVRAPVALGNDRHPVIEPAPGRYVKEVPATATQHQNDNSNRT